MRLLPWVACIGPLCAGCSHPLATRSVPPVTHLPSNLTRVYEFKGKGRQPVLNGDTTKKIQWVEVGPKKSSTIADSLHSGSWLYETYTGGRIGLATGSVVELKTITLVFEMGNTLESVQGT